MFTKKYDGRDKRKISRSILNLTILQRYLRMHVFLIFFSEKALNILTKLIYKDLKFREFIVLKIMKFLLNGDIYEWLCGTLTSKIFEMPQQKLFFKLYRN